MEAAPNKPYDVLRKIADASITASSGLPAQTEVTPLWTGVGFMLAGRRMVASMNEVTEMMTVPSVTRLPGVRPWMKGVANLRGRLLPLVDMELFFETGDEGVPMLRRVISIEAGDLYAGLVLNQVFGMQHFPIDTYRETAEDVPEAIAPYIEGSYHHMGQTWTVFSPELLSQDSKFLDAAAK